MLLQNKVWLCLVVFFVHKLHIGASIKDLDKKWFGFSKMEILTPDELVKRINRE